ncbi:hypothetical protein Tco_0074818 [Tanacetum coccineum]
MIKMTITIQPLFMKIMMLQMLLIQSTARQSTVTPRTLNFDDEAGPSSPIRPTQEEKKLTLQQIRALETANDEEVATKVQEEWDAEEERKRLEDLKKPKELKKPKTISKKPTSLAQETTQMMNFLKGQGYKNLQKLRCYRRERDEKRLLRKRKATVTEEHPSKKLKLRTETIDELRNYLRIVDFEKSAQDRESLEAI